MIDGLRTTAVTVTYADRVDLCTRTVDAALAAGVDVVVVVRNGLDVAVTRRLEEALSARPVRWVSLPTNEGSAGGFSAGLAAARAGDADLIWVLDDDNVADPSALQVLHAARAALVAADPGADPALLAYRPDDAPQRRVHDGGRVDAVFAPPGSVLSFDAFSRNGRRAGSARHGAVVRVPYGPYGGLLLSRAALDRVPGPRLDFHLYEDDTEFTWRVGRAQGLHLVLDAVVQDADGKWSGTSEDGSGPLRLLRAEDEGRRRFGVRNRVAFDVERASAEAGTLRLGVNLALYAAVLVALAARDRRASDLRAVLGAMVAGIRLGRQSRRAA